MPDPTTISLALVVAGEQAGKVIRDGDTFALEYDNSWRTSASATPVSLSMPLRQRRHTDSVVRAFMWGLLPDNEDVLQRWGREYQVSARNPFALLEHLGEDCAGAVQFVRHDRLRAILEGDGRVEWLTSDEIAGRIRLLRKDPAAWHGPDRTGRFSLAGAQAKTALLRDPKVERWGVPHGRVPTTHILKPAVKGLDGHDLNEHLCLTAARLIGLEAASSSVISFEDERVIVVERYDRLYTRDGQLSRIHQEDMCQALGLLPTAKYQNDDGPSAERIIELLRHSVRPGRVGEHEVQRFVDALAFNWLIAGTDAHAKNYSLLLRASQVRLAPLYDIASALPYDDMYLPKLRMAMKIGGENRLEALGGRHWREFAVGSGLDPEKVVTRVGHLAALIANGFARAAAEPAVVELASDLPQRLAELISVRAQRCVRALER